MEETQSTRCGEKDWHSHAFSQLVSLSPNLQVFPHLEADSNHFFFTLRKPPSLERQDWLNHQPLANNSSPSTFLPQEDEQWGGRIQLKV